MDTLQAELQDTYPILNIQIVGVNEFGQDPVGANDLMTAGRTIPWLQDVDVDGNQASDVWRESWDVVYRDVIIVDGLNETVDVYNLTANDLGVAANYATFRDKLLDAAMTEQTPWQNQRDRYDINDDGFVVPGDVLIMVNDINANDARKLPPPTGASLAAPYWDTNGDNFFSPVDVLQVINAIEEANAEGEASGDPEMVAAVANGAILTTASLPSTELESTANSVVETAPEAATEADTAAIVSKYEAPASDRSEPAMLDEDDFWAGYWPSL